MFTSASYANDFTTGKAMADNTAKIDGVAAAHNVVKPNDAETNGDACKTATLENTATMESVGAMSSVAAADNAAATGSTTATGGVATMDSANTPAARFGLPLHAGEANDAKRAKPHLKAAVRYGIAAAGCILFALIYAQFSHGVYSPFMTFMFTIPLAGGVVPAIVLHAAKAKPLPVATRQAWALAIASLTVASCLKGVFDIAGTASLWLAVYLVIAGAFAIIAATTYAKNRKPNLQAC